MAEASTAAVPGAAGRSYGAPSYRGYVLVLLTLVYTLNFIDRNLLSVIAQPVINAFNLSDTEYGFLNGPPFAIFYALMGIPIAIAADRPIAALVVGYLLSVPYNILVLVGVWRSAERDDGPPARANLIRIVTLVGMILLSLT